VSRQKYFYPCNLSTKIIGLSQLANHFGDELHNCLIKNKLSIFSQKGKLHLSFPFKFLETSRALFLQLHSLSLMSLSSLLLRLNLPFIFN